MFIRRVSRMWVEVRTKVRTGKHCGGDGYIRLWFRTWRGEKNGEYFGRDSFRVYSS